jgi:hypothetical protein
MLLVIQIIQRWKTDNPKQKIADEMVGKIHGLT